MIPSCMDNHEHFGKCIRVCQRNRENRLYICMCVRVGFMYVYHKELVHVVV